MTLKKATLLRISMIASTTLCAACAEGTAPQLSQSAPATLRVTNATCRYPPGGNAVCDTLQILAFPGDAEQPHTPGGFWSLDVGTVATASACLTLPDTATFRIIGPSDTVVISWTRDDSVSLGALEPGASRLMAMPSTRGFVPANAQGWSVTLPGDTMAIAAAPCG
ncbi:MAG: hypothetical protein LJF06_11735 [Gemmatimonadetes bacterium]|nr:hypothetical protein [Gemmatimonadota bacterium]